MSGGREQQEQTHHPEGVVEKDHAYREKVQEKIVTGAAANRVSLVTVFANTLLELQVAMAAVGPGGYSYKCGCKVVFAGQDTTVNICEVHR